ncbi:MAG: phage tail assembly chaperone [Pseudomonadota bacterium]
MSESFGAAAARHWNLAARVLGWRPTDFWRSTPTELIASLKDPADDADTVGPSRERIAQMMERDSNG